MKTIILIFSSVILTLSNCFSQQQKDYIITLDNEKVFCEIKKTNYKRIVIIKDGEKIKYRAKDIFGYKNGDYLYESGKGKVKYLWRQWVFLKKTIDGDMNLYEINIEVTDKARGGTKISTHHYIRRSNNYMGIFLSARINNFKKICSDCPEFTEKISYERNQTSVEDKVDFFNKNCGKKPTNKSKSSGTIKK
ncbi:MAG: hypothetical protein WC223_12210 [Bacteroidales bacterium]|jgi:hypothetical protein